MEASDPINPMSAVPERTAVMVLSAPNGTVQLVQDASQKIDGGYGMVFIHMNLLNDGTPESSAIFL